MRRRARASIATTNWPISDLRTTSADIARTCLETGEPVFITRNGEDLLVIMSMEAWDRERARIDLYGLLGDAEAKPRPRGGGTARVSWFIVSQTRLTALEACPA